MIRLPYHLIPLSELTCEDDHQRALVSWIRTPETITEYPMLLWLFAVPNGGKRNIQTASMLKQTGVTPGVPDLMLLYPSNGYHGLIIEMKYGHNKLSKEQEKFIYHHSKLGYKCVVCWNWIDAREQIINYLSKF